MKEAPGGEATFLLKIVIPGICDQEYSQIGGWNTMPRKENLCQPIEKKRKDCYNMLLWTKKCGFLAANVFRN